MNKGLGRRKGYADLTPLGNVVDVVGKHAKVVAVVNCCECDASGTRFRSHLFQSRKRDDGTESLVSIHLKHSTGSPPGRPHSCRIDQAAFYPGENARQALKSVGRMTLKLRFNEKQRLLPGVRQWDASALKQVSRQSDCQSLRYPHAHPQM
jgi:hypothetical protein